MCSLNETVSVEPDTEDQHSDLLDQDLSMEISDSPHTSNLGVSKQHLESTSNIVYGIRHWEKCTQKLSFEFTLGRKNSYAQLQAEHC